MTDNEWGDFLGRLADLFPDKINPEQARAWKAMVLRLDATEAGAALTEYFAAEPTATPKLSRFLRCVRQKKETARETPRDVTFDLQTAKCRKQMAYALPNLHAEIYGWSNEKFWERYSGWEFGRFCVKDRGVPLRPRYDARATMYTQWKHWAARIGADVGTFDEALAEALA
jgi:hypothetical protein